MCGPAAFSMSRSPFDRIVSLYPADRSFSRAAITSGNGLMRAPPPSDETVRLSIPAFPRQERRDSLSKSFLHIDDGAVLVEREYFDFALQDVGRFHRVSLQLREALTICGMSARGPSRRFYVVRIMSAFRVISEMPMRSH